MTQKTIWGRINADRSSDTGSGDYTVADKVETGFYTVIFNEGSFNATPAVVGTASNDSDHAPVLYVTDCDSSQFTVELRSSATQDRYDLDFYFIATGTSDDDNGGY